MPIATRGIGPAPPVPTAQVPILPNPIGDLTSAVQASTGPRSSIHWLPPSSAPVLRQHCSRRSPSDAAAGPDDGRGH
jgi:hypothetical protein